MMTDTRIKVSVDDQGTISSFDRMENRVKQMFSNLVESSRKYSTSSKEVIKDLEEQIRYAEKLNRIEEQKEKRNLYKEWTKGDVSDKEYRQISSTITQEYREKRLEQALLRELIETVKRSGKESIRENRDAVKEQIKASKTVDVLDPKGKKAEDILLETVQRGLIGDVSESEVRERYKFKNAGRTAIGAGSDFIQSKNEIYGAAAVAGTVGGAVGGTIGLIIQTIAGGFQKVLQGAERMEAGARSKYQVRGSKLYDNWFDRQKEDFNPYASGYTYSDILIAGSAYQRANINNDVYGNMYAESGLGIDRGLLTSLAKTQRGTREMSSSTLNMLAGTISGVSGDSNATRAYLPEYLTTLIDLNKKQLSVVGKIDSEVNVKMLGYLTSLNDKFNNPEMLASISGSFYQGLRNPSSPQVEALQYQVLSKANPKASFWELQKMRANPFEGDYLQNMVKSVTSMSGNKEDAYMMLMQMIPGLEPQIAEDIINGVVDPSALKSSKDVKVKYGYNLGKESREATGWLASKTARFSGMAEYAGYSSTEFMKEFGEKMDEIFGGKEINSNIYKNYKYKFDPDKGEIGTEGDTTGFREATKQRMLLNSGMFEELVKTMETNSKILKELNISVQENTKLKRGW